MVKGKGDNLTRSPRVIKSSVDFSTYIQLVEKKAYELYEKKGRQQGHDLDDWLEAQRLVETELCFK